jgi:hypothetical protein
MNAVHFFKCMCAYNENFFGGAYVKLSVVCQPDRHDVFQPTNLSAIFREILRYQNMLDEFAQ